MKRTRILNLLVALLAAGCDYQRPVELDFHLDHTVDAQIVIRDRLDVEPPRSYSLSSGSDAHRSLLGWLDANQSGWFASEADQAFVQVEVSVGDIDMQLVENAVRIRFQGTQYLKPVETAWLIAELVTAEP